MALGVDSASNRNEYREYFLGVKGGRCVRLTTYHHRTPLSRNMGTLTYWNPLGYSRPVTGLIYPFFFSINSSVVCRIFMVVMKCGAGVLYKRLLIQHAFRENEPTVIHNLLANESELPT